jgi:HEAT repeat protein
MKFYARCLLFSASLLSVSPACAQPGEAELLAILKSDAPQQQKGEACIDLGHVGTRVAVAPLAALLGDEKLAHMARYALETIPDPAVDEALRAALAQLKGKPLVGVIQSVGVRRDAKAVDALAARLSDADAEVAAAAAASLGRIATPAAVSALKPSLGQVPASAEGLLRCAEAAAPDQAAPIYDALRAAQVPAHVKVAATRGAILSRGAAGLPVLLEQLRGEDAVLFGAALRAALELPGPEATQALAAELGKLPAVKQGRVCDTLGQRGDLAAVPALLALAREGAAESRVAAIRALTRLGDASAVPALAEIAVAGDDEPSKAALAALAGFPNPAADAAIVALAGKPDAKLRRAGIDLVSRRRISAAVPELLRLAGDADPEIRVASLKAAGELAGVKEIPALLDILLKTPATDAAADALAAVCARAAVPVAGAIAIRKAEYGALPDGPSKDVTAKVAELVKAGQVMIDAENATFGDTAPGKVKKLRVEYTVNGVAKQATVNENASLRLNVESALTASPEVTGPLLAAYEKAQGAPKRALLRILCSAGGDKALAVVRAATADADAELKESALRALCDWPSADALPDLEKMIQAPPSPKFKILALRGYVRLVEVQTAPPAAKAASLKQAFGWAERDEERRLALASLGAAPCPEALAFAAEHLGNAALKDDACQGAVDVAETLAVTHADLVMETLRKVVKAGAKEGTLKRARRAMNQLKKEGEQAQSEEGFVPMFNGKDLAGWEQKGGVWWKAVDGVLTAESTADTPLATNNHLLWKGGTPGDFEIRTEFRLSKSANSGIQLRCEALTDKDTGYQADMNGGGNYVGFIYHPKMHLIGGRGERVTLEADGKKSAQRFAPAAELQKLYKVEDWNTYRVVCKGPEITLYLNGSLMTQVTDLRPDTPRKGSVTVQLHKGPPMKIEYRNLRIKELK